MKNIISFFVGFIFALGLGLSGMTQVHVVRGFLDITGDWNMNLLGVMIGAIFIHSLLFFLSKNVRLQLWIQNSIFQQKKISILNY